MTCVRGCEAQSYNYLQAERRKNIIICHFLPLEADHAFSRWEDIGRQGQGGGEDEEGKVATFWQECDYCFTFHLFCHIVQAKNFHRKEIIKSFVRIMIIAVQLIELVVASEITN